MSKEAHMLTKQETLLEKVPWPPPLSPPESSRVREPRRTALPHGSQSQALWWWGITFQVIFGQLFWLRSPSWWCTRCSVKRMPGRRILGDDRTCGVSFGPFLNSSDWWWLISSCSLLGPPSVMKLLMQIFTMVPGQGGRFQSVCFP